VHVLRGAGLWAAASWSLEIGGYILLACIVQRCVGLGGDAGELRDGRHRSADVVCIGRGMHRQGVCVARGGMIGEEKGVEELHRDGVHRRAGCVGCGEEK
jgi:hypothetical protein